MPPLPDWCEIPIDIKQAALVLGVSRKTLDVMMKDSSFKAGVHFELRGNRKVFYREHIKAMRKELTKCACTSKIEVVGNTPVGLDLTVGPSESLLALKTLVEQKKH